jgi:ABC-type multidrug transport system fused ATPase/permease subunit
VTDAPPSEAPGERPAEEPPSGASGAFPPPAIADPIPDAEAAVVIDGATKRFGDDTAVDQISLIVRTGTILGIIGPSGSGKTTTIRLLTGALAPTEGHVRVLGEDPRAFHRQTRERIGYMPQQFTLYPDLTARENVDFVASLFGIAGRARYSNSWTCGTFAVVARAVCPVACSGAWSSHPRSSMTPT